NDFANQVFAPIDLNETTTPLILQNVTERFARTMVELTSKGRPFTNAMTAQELMMTTALKELYAFLEAQESDKEGNIKDRLRTANRTIPMVVEAPAGPIPIAETLDPAGPNYMHWYDPDIATEEKVPECQMDPAMLPPTALGLHWLLLGTLDG